MNLWDALRPIRSSALLLALGASLAGPAQGAPPALGTPFGAPVAAQAETAGRASAYHAPWDLDGDGRSELLWRHAASGALYVMHPWTDTGAMAWTEPDADWRVAGVGDLDGDGRADLVWWNRRTGMVYGMLMDGATVRGGGVLHVERDTDWRIQAVADLDGDGKADLVWRHAVSGMVYVMPLDGLATKPGALVWTEPDPHWTIQGAADFDGDGKADLLWRNDQTGVVYLMRMSGTTVLGGSVLHTEPDLAWTIQALADVDGDGTCDLVWRSAATGYVYVMPVQGGQVRPGAVVWMERDAAWRIVAAGDYAGHGRSALAWWNASTGAVYVMDLNGAAVSGGALVHTEPDLRWNILGTRDAQAMDWLVAYDSGALTGTPGWGAHWHRDAWENTPIPTQEPVPAPDRPGRTAMEVAFGADNGWNAIGVARRDDWNHVYPLFLNQFRTFEFDIRFVSGSTGADQLSFVLEDAGHADEPYLVDLIPGWATMTDAQRYDHWHHVVVDFQKIHAKVDLYPSVERLLFFLNAGADVARPHFFLTDIRLGWVADTTAPRATLVQATPSLTYDQLTLAFTTDEPALWRVDYGPGLSMSVQGGTGDDAYASSHTAVLKGLSPGTDVPWRITVTDHPFPDGATVNRGFLQGTFAMPGTPTTPPVLTGLAASDLRANRATLTWTTDRPCTAAVAWRKPGGAWQTRTLADYQKDRTFVLDLLEAATAYEVTVSVTDAFALAATAGLGLTTTGLTAADVTVTLDPAATRPISPAIYGTNQNLGAPWYTLGRMGGNRYTAFNWITGYSHAGTDWYNQNDDYLPWVMGVTDAEATTPGATILHGLDQILGTQAAPRGQAALITVPVQGYIAADALGNGDVNQTPDWIHKRFKPLQAVKGAPFATDWATLTAAPKVYTDEYVHWVQTVALPRHPGREVYYCLDNEPDLWAFTHPRIQASQVTYPQLCDLDAAAAAAVKAQAPDAKVFGFVSYGWYGFTWLQGSPDGNGGDHGTWGDFTDYWLGRMRDASTAAGKRLVDVLDIHWYTEAQASNGTGVGSGDTSDATNAARVQAPRSLWDPTYVERSWISDLLPDTDKAIRLLPRLQAKIDAAWPGTGLAITEYNYRGGKHISGAIAQADALGIFGAQGVFAACRWQMDDSEPFIEGAFKMFRGFDGTAGFGDTAVKATSSDAAKVSAYASRDAANPSRVVLVAINRSTTFQDVSFQGMPLSGTARVWRLTSTNSDPTLVGELPVSGSPLVVTLPPMTVNTLEIQPR